MAYAPLARSVIENDRNRLCSSVGERSFSNYLLTRSTFPHLFPIRMDTEVTPVSPYTDLPMLTQIAGVSIFLGVCGEGGLRGYQWNGVFWITHLRRCGLGAALCDEMGTGKTAQAIASLVVHRLEDKPSPRPMLVVCPASVIPHWAREIKKFVTNPCILTPVYYTRQLLSELKKKDNGNIVVLVSYSTLARDQTAFSQFIWDAVVVDEIHLIRNPTTPNAKAVFSLRAKFRIALTGTPIQDNVEDIWSTMNFIIPGFLGEFSAFDENYVKPIQLSLNYRKRKTEESSELSPQTTLNEYFEISAVGIEKLNLVHRQVI